MRGKLIAKQPVELKAGVKSFSLTLPAFGIYFITLKTQEAEATKRIVAAK